MGAYHKGAWRHGPGGRSDMAVSVEDPPSRRGSRCIARGRRAPAAPVVLVVAQERAIRDALATLLENSGYAVTLTSDGTTALCQVRDGRVDLVLLDGDLPGHSGLDLCQRMWAAARDAAVHLPILLLTPVVRPEDPCAG